MRLLAIALLVVLAPSLAAAQSGRLWSERPQGATAVTPLPDFSTLADQLVPAVVSIQVEQKVTMRRRGDRIDPHEFFFGPFGGVPREFRNRGLGSGFFISREGLILTNNHVVENADQIEVTFMTKDGLEKKLEAKVLGTAPDYDVALIQTNENANAPVAHLGDSERVKIGEWVMAIGNPFGLSHSVSVGIISAKERRDIQPSGRSGLYDFLQTDASINPGNSGGPLINLRGEVIGINSAINAAGAGIGFAIPINMVKTMLPDLKAKGRFARSWIGIKIQNVTAELAQSYGMRQPAGALISEVIAGSPAGEAGLREGDIILEFDGKTVRSYNDLPLFASMAGVGRKVAIKYWRSNKEQNATLELAEHPTDEERLAAASPDESSGGLGILVADITPALQRQFELEAGTGVVVKSVDPGSGAARAGIVPGDVILSLNGQAIRRARDLKEGVDKVEAGGVLRMQIARQGGRQFVAVRKPGR